MYIYIREGVSKAAGEPLSRVIRETAVSQDIKRERERVSFNLGPKYIKFIAKTIPFIHSKCFNLHYKNNFFFPL